jgi:PEP-CTERM motif
MPTLNRWTSLGATLAALLSGTCAAQIPPSTYVAVTAGYNTNSSTSPLPQSLSISGVGLDGLGNGDATAVASFGRLGVVADATAVPAEAFPTVNAAAEASFTDNLFIAGPASLPVSLTFSLELSGECSTTPGASFGHANAACGANASLGGPPTLSIGVSDTQVSSSATITWVTNAILPIVADLRAGGFAYNGLFDASFGDTLHVFAFSTTPGVTITSTSGHDYSPLALAPVPEPETWAMLAAGLIGLVSTRGKGSLRRGCRIARARPAS